MTQVTVQNIPFVAGKSVSKSHNIGVKIQETKSLMNTQLKIPKSKQNLQLQASKLENNSIKQSSLMSFEVLKNGERMTTCPALKHSSHIITNFYNEDELSNDEEKTTIEEMWADYMFQIENKTIIPVKCTCFTDKKNALKQTKVAEINVPCQQSTKAKKKQSKMYLEARKVMNKCRVVFNSSEEEIISKDTDTLVEEDYNKKTSRQNKIARYMRQIRKIQDYLKQ